MKRKGYGLGKGMGYKNLMPMDSHIHSLSAKGVSTVVKQNYMRMLGDVANDDTIKNLKVGYRDMMLNLKDDINTKKLKAMGNLKSFVIDSEYSVVVWAEDTRTGFRHLAKLMKNGVEIETAKAVYYNRTWERYNFQTVINSVIRKHFDEKKAEEKIKLLEKKAGLYRMDAKGKVPKIKDKMTLDEVEKRFRYELDKGMINTRDTPHYDGVTQFGNMLSDMGIKVIDAKGKKFKGWDIKKAKKWDDLSLDEQDELTEKYYKERDVLPYGEDDKLSKTMKNILEIEENIDFNAKGKKISLYATYDLATQYDSRNSFYGKARVDVDDTNPRIKTLYSYNTKVAEVRFGKPKVFGLYSQTTTRHIKEFLKQEGFKVESSDQIIEDYGA